MKEFLRQGTQLSPAIRWNARLRISISPALVHSTESSVVVDLLPSFRRFFSMGEALVREWYIKFRASAPAIPCEGASSLRSADRKTYSPCSAANRQASERHRFPKIQVFPQDSPLFLHVSPCTENASYLTKRKLHSKKSLWRSDYYQHRPNSNMSLQATY